VCSVWHVWRRHACSALARKAERKRSLVRPKCKLQENIEMYVKEMMEGGGAHSSGSRQGHVGGGTMNTKINTQFSKNAGNLTS
jgi:hypothetical protein